MCSRGLAAGSLSKSWSSRERRPSSWSWCQEQKVKIPSDHCDERVKTLCVDVLRLNARGLLSHAHLDKGFSVILSDMCPPVSGIGSKDAALSSELGLKALGLAVGGRMKYASVDGDDGHESCCDTEQGVLLPGGSLVIKLLEGEESQGFPRLCKRIFKSTMWLRPKATRPASREIYLIAKCLRWQVKPALGLSLIVVDVETFSAFD